MISRVTFSALLILIFTAIGCGQGDPVSPGIGVDGELGPDTRLGSGNHVSLSYGTIEIDPDGMDAKVVPARSSEFHVNATSMLESLHCVDCLRIENFSKPALGEYYFDLVIKHPYDTGNLKFTAFDVRAIIFLDSNQTFPTSGLSWPSPMLAGPSMQNADGYTFVFNPLIYHGTGPLSSYYHGKLASTEVPDSLLNPYKDFQLNTERRHFAPGSETMAGIHLKLPGTQPVIGYAIDASWHLPYVDPPENIPNDFPLSANIAEAYALVGSVEQNTLYYQDSTNTGGEASIRLSVFDWQGSMPVDMGGTVNSVFIESPSWFFDIDVEPEEVTEGYLPAEHTDYLFKIDYTPTSSGTFPLLMAVQDVLDVSQGFSDYYAIEVVWVDVADAPINLQPVADPSNSMPKSGPAPLTVQLDPSASYDPDGTIVLYEWDLDNDDVYDLSSSVPDPIGWVFDEVGHWPVSLRVTDDMGAMDVGVTDVLVEPPLNEPPVADLSMTAPTSGAAPLEVTLDGSLSYDNDGEVVLWEWDVDDDGVYEFALPSDTPVVYVFDEIGDVLLRLRVTDDDGDSGVDEVLIQVE